MKKSQKDWVKEQLQTYGEVTRNQCLQQRISRLSAIMLTLKNEGMNFTTFERGGDYVYSLGKPVKKIKPQLIYDPVQDRMVYATN